MKPVVYQPWDSRSCPISVNGKVYSSFTQAVKCTGISYPALIKRVKSDEHPEVFYPDIIPIDAFVIDGTRFGKTITQAEEFTGLSWTNITDRLKSAKCKDSYVLYADGTRLKKAPKFSNATQKKPLRKSTFRAVIYEGVRYPAVTDLARKLRMHESTLHTLIRRGKFEGAYFESHHPFRINDGMRYLCNGEIYMTLEAAAKRHGITKAGISYRLGSPEFPNFQYLLPNGDTYKDRKAATEAFWRYRSLRLKKQ